MEAKYLFGLPSARKKKTVRRQLLQTALCAGWAALWLMLAFAS